MSALLVPFLYELRRRQIKGGTEELISLAKGTALGLHGNTLEGFYRLSRSLLVHRESDLDRFDQAFSAHFRGVDMESRDARLLLESLLRDASSGGAAGLNLDPGELPEWLREMLEAAGANDPDDAQPREEGVDGIGRRAPRPPRLPMGGDAASSGRARSLGMADARRYRRYRSDLVLDVRQIELALRRLRSFSRDGREDELDVEGTVDRTARAFGELEVVLRPPWKSRVRMVLLMDVGGSMEPFATLCSHLFSAAKRASNLREVRSYYFHNVPYGRVFSTDGRMMPPAPHPGTPAPAREILRRRLQAHREQGLDQEPVVMDKMSEHRARVEARRRRDSSIVSFEGSSTSTMRSIWWPARQLNNGVHVSSTAVTAVSVVR